MTTRVASLRVPLATMSRAAALVLIGLYRIVVSPLVLANLGPACRFEPSCSVYARQAIARYGLGRGAWLAFKRLLRCRPGGEWGYDPVNLSAGATSGGAGDCSGAPRSGFSERGALRGK